MRVCGVTIRKWGLKWESLKLLPVEVSEMEAGGGGWWGGGEVGWGGGEVEVEVEKGTLEVEVGELQFVHSPLTDSPEAT